MTTIVGIKKKDKIILAADSRTTSGTYKYNVSTDKITDMGNYAIAFAGLGIFKDILRANQEILLRAFSDITHSNILEFIGELHSLFSKYDIERVKTSDERFRYDFSGCIITKTGHLFYITGAPDYTEFEDICAVGSGATYAEGALAILYNNNIDITKMATKAIKAVSNFDLGTDQDIKYISYTIGNEG